MKRAGIRELKQNASAVVAEVVAGEVVTITDRGRAVAQLVPLRSDRLDGLLESGRARAPRRRRAGDQTLTDVLEGMRGEARY